VLDSFGVGDAVQVSYSQAPGGALTAVQISGAS